MPEILITGAGGQLGRALRDTYPDARQTNADELDISDAREVANYDWSEVEVILNAAAYTNVDGAETAEGRLAAWKVNAEAVANLVRVATKQSITLVHISSDYVFDGSQESHAEDEPLSPLSSYGASKAAGDLLVQNLEKYYLLRTSWLIGEGKNFVKTMLELGAKGINPTVVADQVGRLTFTDQLVEAINHLLKSEADFGTYNVTNDGQPASWAEIAREIFECANLPIQVSETTTEAYFASKPNVARRPLNSSYDLSKIKATGLELADWRDELKKYIEGVEA